MNRRKFKTAEPLAEKLHIIPSGVHYIDKIERWAQDYFKY